MPRTVYFELFTKKRSPRTDQLFNNISAAYKKSYMASAAPGDYGTAHNTLETVGSKEYHKEMGIKYYPTLLIQDGQGKELSRIVCNIRNYDAIKRRFDRHYQGEDVRQPLGDFPRNLPCVVKKYWYVPVLVSLLVLVYFKYLRQ